MDTLTKKTKDPAGKIIEEKAKFYIRIPCFLVYFTMAASLALMLSGVSAAKPQAYVEAAQHSAVVEHTPGQVVVENRTESTCSVAGSYEKAVYCTVCDAEISRSIVTLSLKEHTPAEDDNNCATAVHVGDSRLYLLRKDKIIQITTDHSLAMEHIRRGLLTKAEADHSKIQNILTRAMGIKKNIEFDLLKFPVHEGDILLLCSDGLYKGLSEEQIGAILRAGRNMPLVKLCKQLVHDSNDKDGQDNISCVLVKILPPQKLTFMQRLKQLFK